MFDSSRKLSLVQRNDPRRLLSHEARIRIDDAHMRCLALIAEAQARREYLDPKQAALEWSAARMNGAFGVLEVVLLEFMAIGRRVPELGLIMKEEIEAASSSLELTQFETSAVESRLYTVRPKSESSVVEITEGKRLPQPGTSADSAFLAKNLEHLRLKHGLSYGKISAGTGIDKKAVIAHHHGTRTALDTTLSSYAGFYKCKGEHFTVEQLKSESVSS